MGKRSKARIGRRLKSQKNSAKEELFKTIELPPNWTNVSDVSSDLRLCVIGYQECEDSPPLVVTRSLVINGSQQTWQVHIHGHKLDPSVISNLADIPNNLDVNTASILLNRLSELNICAGNPEPKFISLGKTKKNPPITRFRSYGFPR